MAREKLTIHTNIRAFTLYRLVIKPSYSQSELMAHSLQFLPKEDALNAEIDVLAISFKKI